MMDAIDRLCRRGTRRSPSTIDAMPRA